MRSGSAAATAEFDERRTRRDDGVPARAAIRTPANPHQVLTLLYYGLTTLPSASHPTV